MIFKEYMIIDIYYKKQIQKIKNKYERENKKIKTEKYFYHF